MKFIVAQLAFLFKGKLSQTNIKLLSKFFLILLAFFIIYSVLFHFLMKFENREYSWITGLYWTLTVMSTLGFGDITFNSDIGRIFSIIVLLNGIVFLLVILPFTFIQFFYAPWLDAHNKARAPKSVQDDVSDHVIFTNFDSSTTYMIDRCRQYTIPYVLLVPELTRALELYDLGYKVVLGQLDDPDTYARLRVSQAALVVVMNDDMAATNIISTIRETSDTVSTVTNADLDDSLDILRLAGSTHVFQFTKMLGKALARRVLGISMQANVIGRFDELMIAEAPAMQTVLQGKTLAESRLRQIAGVTVVGIWEKGRFEIPGPETRINASTVLVLAGSEEQLGRYDEVIRLDRSRDIQQGPVLVLGGGRVGRSVAETLEARGIDYRVVEKRPVIASKSEKFVLGSAGDLDVLIQAGIYRTPSIIVTTHDDDLNIYLTIYCRKLRLDAQIISRASLDRNINTLHRAGANLVMSFTSLCANTIMNLLKPGKLLMLSEGLHIFRAVLESSLVGRSLAENRIRETTGCTIIAVKRAERMIINPDPEMVLQTKDELILVGAADAEKEFIQKYPVS